MMQIAVAILWCLMVVMLWTFTGIHALPQHRVRKASRSLEYHHTRNNDAKGRRLPHSKFWIPSKRSDQPSDARQLHANERLRAGGRESSLKEQHRQESKFTSTVAAPPAAVLHHDAALGLWYLHGDYANHNESPEQVYQRRKHERKLRKLRSRLAQSGEGSSGSSFASESPSTVRSWIERNVGSFRTLAGQQQQVYPEEDTSYAVGDKDSGYTAGDTDLIYEGNGPGGGAHPLNETQTWNVSTEVEFGSSNEQNPPNNSSSGGGGATHNDTSSSGSNATSSVVYTTTTEESNETHTIFQPIRIRAILSEQGNGGEFLTEKERMVLFQDILSPAIVAWSAALRVDPVVGNLTVDASQLYDGVTCGPGLDSGHPSVPVPLSHIQMGIPDTDVVVYISLGFVTEPNTLNPFAEDLTGTSNASTATSASNNNNETNTTASETAAGKWSFHSNSAYGLQDENRTVEWPTCTGEYLADASYCSTDQYDRPTAALLHLCIDDSFFLERSLERDISTVMHELGHALGFNTQSMAHFRRPDGTPITERKDGDVVDSEVECTGPRHANRRSEVLPLPSEEILQFRTVRGVRVAEVVTPSVRQVVRNHFDCQELDGAELESGNVFVANETLDKNVTDVEAVDSCIGDHWEKRLFRIDLMNPIVDEVPFSLRFSPVTLALFADSGWYQVDLSRTTYSASWGRAAGCSFVNDTCVSEYGEIAEANTQFFCNQVASSRQGEIIDEIHGCSPDLTRKAACSMSQYDWELPREYQYFNFTLGSNVGGSEPLLDYCPVYNGFANGLCKDGGNQRILQVNRIEKFGKKNSRCVGGVVGKRRTALCLSIACVIEDRTLRVKVDGIWHLCHYSGQVISIAGDLESSVICPDPIRTCPTFYCHRDCLGTGGTCDYDTGVCMCSLETSKGRNVTGKCGELQTDRPEYDVVFYDDDESAKPLDDSSISDYYVPTEWALRDEDKRLEPWMIAVIVIGGVLVFVFVIGAFALRAVRKRRRSADDQVSFWVWRSPHQADVPDAHDASPGANKDKFVASMLVDMRVNDGNARAREDSQAESIAETENSVTETESSGNCTKASLNESMEQSLEHFDELVHGDQVDVRRDEAMDEFALQSEVPASVMRKRTIFESS